MLGECDLDCGAQETSAYVRQANKVCIVMRSYVIHAVKLHGVCQNGTCTCIRGWSGAH